jgi:hypothetical protein
MPDDNEGLIKAGTQGIVEGIMKPLNDLVGELFGPGATEAGLLIRDYIRVYRISRLTRLLQKAEMIFNARKITPKPVAPKLLTAILESGSLEDDDNLQDRWAALLVSSSDNRESSDLLPSAPEILKQLTPWEVLLLQNCFDALTMDSIFPYPHPERQSQMSTVIDWQNEVRFQRGFDQSGMGYHYDFTVMIDNLIRLGLLRTKPLQGDKLDVHMTTAGYKFIELCQTWTGEKKMREWEPKEPIDPK